MTELTDAGNVSACLVSWKRPHNMRAIVEELQRLPLIDEILVWNNNPAIDLRLDGSKVRVIRSEQNLGCSARVLCAARARNEIVYTQDDDALVRNIPELHEVFLADPTRITHALSEWHYPRRARHLHGECHVALLGWGALFHRSWIRELERLPAAVRRSDLFRREADKYFTILLGRHHTTVRARVEQLDGHSDPAIALWTDPRHRQLSALAIREALALWRERHRPHLPARWNVVTTCRNYGRYLQEAVQSALGNEADTVITVVDDGSIDDSADVADELATRYTGIDVVRLPHPRGPSAAANCGIATNDSVYVVRLQNS